MSESSSAEYRDVVKETLDRVEALIPDVKSFADSTNQINELAGERDKLYNERNQRLATLSPDELSDLTGRAKS